MTHFSLAVFTDDLGSSLEDLLAPFDEDLECEPHINMTRNDVIKEGRENYEQFADLTDDELLEKLRGTGDYSLDDEGNDITTYNQHSKWDWYVIGGRWSDMIRVKYEYTPYEGLLTDSCLVRYADFSPDPEEYTKSIRFWELAVEGAEPTEEERKRFFCMYRPQYFLDRYTCKENYARIQSLWTTWAVLTPDGKWHEKGEMGWFGMSNESHDQAVSWDETYKEKFLDTADPDWTITVVDCHI
jgi:hypothetical protein